MRHEFSCLSKTFGVTCTTVREAVRVAKAEEEEERQLWLSEESEPDEAAPVESAPVERPDAEVQEAAVPIDEHVADRFARAGEQIAAAPSLTYDPGAPYSAALESLAALIRADVDRPPIEAEQQIVKTSADADVSGRPAHGVHE